MSQEFEPFLPKAPGDAITAEIWNELQCRVQEDCSEKIEQAIAEISEVPSAADAAKLEGKTLDEIRDAIVERAVAEARTRGSYLKLFLKLHVGETREVEHGLGACPLTDVYQLDYFPVVCCEDKETRPQWTSFYIFQSDEKTLRTSDVNGKKIALEIQPKKGPVSRYAFAEMLDRFAVEFTDDSALSDVVNEFWKALFSPPNDEFDDDQYCYSPWFDKCCREEMSVRDIKKKGHWDDLWVQWRARRTINYPGTAVAAVDSDTPGGGFFSRNNSAMLVQPAPTQIQVEHFDFNRLGITLLAPPIHPAELSSPTNGMPPISEQFEDIANELKVMVLLKC